MKTTDIKNSIDIAFVGALALALNSCKESPPPDQALTPAEARAIAKEAGIEISFPQLDVHLNQKAEPAQVVVSSIHTENDNHEANN